MNKENCALKLVDEIIQYHTQCLRDSASMLLCSILSVLFITGINMTVMLLVQLPLIRKVPGSRLDSDTGYPDRFL